MYSFNYSIIIPYRDKYDLLLTAVRSIPDREDIQILIIDNSEVPLSDEKVPYKIRAHVDFLTSSPTKGGGCARNVGLKNVMGQFLLFLDADDYFMPTAFEVFDKYLDKSFDIIFFKSDSVNLIDGSRSTRHEVVNHLIDTYQKTGDDNVLRYQYVNPIAKMIRADYVLQKGLRFDETRVGNDVWFSIISGHEARTIMADDAVVYMITAGNSGSSLTRIRTKENWFIRFQIMVRVNKFLKTVGKYKYRIRLIGALRIAWRDFGYREFLRFLNYAYSNRVGVF